MTDRTLEAMRQFDPHSFIREHDKLGIFQTSTVGWAVVAGLLEELHKQLSASNVSNAANGAFQERCLHCGHLHQTHECLWEREIERRRADNAEPSQAQEGMTDDQILNAFAIHQSGTVFGTPKYEMVDTQLITGVRALLSRQSPAEAVSDADKNGRNTAVMPDGSTAENVYEAFARGRDSALGEAMQICFDVADEKGFHPERKITAFRCARMIGALKTSPQAAQQGESVFPPLPASIYRHPTLGDLYDRLAVHKYAVMAADVLHDALSQQDKKDAEGGSAC